MSTLSEHPSQHSLPDSWPDSNKGYCPCERCLRMQGKEFRPTYRADQDFQYGPRYGHNDPQFRRGETWAYAAERYPPNAQMYDRCGRNRFLTQYQADELSYHRNQEGHIRR